MRTRRSLPSLFVRLPLGAMLALLAAAPVHAAGGGGGDAQGAGHGKAANAEGSTSPYFVLEPMPVSIVKGGNGKGLLVVEIGLDAKTIEDRQKVEHLTPRLRDFYLQVLRLYAERDLKAGRAPNVDVIADRLQAATDDVLGAGHAKVLLRQVIIRRTL